MSGLSVVVITLNEELNIGKCLDSVIEIADEIIIVDSFSTDKTKEICERYPVKFIQKNWQGYSGTKNFANALASHDYIFSIDADECVSEELKKSIIARKTEGFSGAYTMNRLNNYCGKWIRFGGWYPDKKLRIWNKSEGYWQGNIHEIVVFNNPVNISRLNGDLLHYSFSSVQNHKIQMKKFAEIHANELFKTGKQINLIIIWIKAIWKFKRDYIFKAGFLHGRTGFIICYINAKGTYLKYRLLQNLYKTRKKVQD